MPRNTVPKNAMKKKIEVTEDTRRMVFGKAEKPIAFGPEVSVYLVGLRASGKTSLGRILAEKMARPFVDTDDLVRERAGRTIEEIVASDGWEEFRRLEAEALRSIPADAGTVVATGGGIVLDEKNRDHMRKSGPVFYLMADVGLLASRLQADPKDAQRPSLSELPLEDELRQTLSEREALYLEASNFVLPAQLPLDELVEDVRDKLRLLQRG